MNKAIQAFESYLKRRYPNSSTAKSYVNDLQVFKRLIDKAPGEVSRTDIARFVDDQLDRGLAAADGERAVAGCSERVHHPWTCGSRSWHDGSETACSAGDPVGCQGAVSKVT